MVNCRGRGLPDSPKWFVAFWALPVFGGAAGAPLLLLSKPLAVPVLLLSLLAMVVTALQSFISPRGLYATTGTGPGFVLIIFGLSLGLWLYARYKGIQQVLKS